MSRAPHPETAERFRTAHGGRIDRARRISFTFDGRTLTGHPGDTLASALLANGVHLVGRSFKYHRPRGILAAGPEEPNALVTVRRSRARTTPNLRATEVELYDGLVAESQNRWPSLERDLGSVNDRVAPLIPAGFYYKTLMGPKLREGSAGSTWARVFEPVIRRMAGLGRAPAEADPDRYASRYAHTDVLVVGAGPAGIAAALAAAEAGASVMLADQDSEPGGSLLAETGTEIEGLAAADWLAGALGRLAATGRVRLLPRTTVFGAYPDRMLGLVERLGDHLAAPPGQLPRERLWEVRARDVVLATGAIERPLVFPGNDRPGVMLAGAVRSYLNRFGVLAGTRVVVVAGSGEAFGVAMELAAHGIAVEGVLDLGAGQLTISRARAEAEAAGLRVISTQAVKGTHGRLRVSGVEFIRESGEVGRLGCDLVAMAGGFVPTLQLFPQLGGRLAWDAGRQAFLPEHHVANVHVAGAAAAEGWSVAAALESGFAAGAAAALDLGAAPRPPVHPSVAEVVVGYYAGRFAPPPNAIAGRAFVDFQNDVTAKDIELATREGFTSIEHVKRYTTAGMATDQGKTSGLNAIGVVASSLGHAIGETGHTTFRPPFTPVTFGALAGLARGPLFDPLRRTPLDAALERNGAVFEMVGQWRRARYYPRPGEDMARAVARECHSVRQRVGVLDASTLGKIEVAGPDAARFLDRIYVNGLAGLGVGRCRYAVMLTEAGFVMDDGIVARLAPDRFHVTTTTGGAARVLAHMEDYLQTEFTDCRCWLTSVTEQWAVIAVQGPEARQVLEGLVDDADISAGALAHMGLAEGRILGVPMRLFRVSFTGELGYEVNVPASRGRAVFEAILERAEAAGGGAYGTEAMHVLRAEKGYIIVGQESDGTVMPGDLGLPSGAGKADFVGKRSLKRADAAASDRPGLVGLEVADGGGPLEEGAQLTQRPDPPAGTPASGHVTSAYMSAVLGRPIALGLVNGGRRRIGATLHAPMPGGARRVRVVSPVFYDPKGERLDG